MLYGALPTRPISDMRIRQSEVVDSIKTSPVMLTQNGRGAGILVHPQVWNDMIAVYQKAQEAGLLELRFGETVDWAAVEAQLGRVDRAAVA